MPDAAVAIDDPLNNEPDPTSDPAPDPAPETSKTVLDQADDDKPVVTEFPENWRGVMAGDDEKTLKLLDRYASPQAAAKALLEFRQKLSKGELAKPLGDNPTEEELADYRANLGIPANASEYNTDVDGVVFGEDDKVIIDDFLEAAHGAHYTPSQVTTALRWYNQLQEKEAADQADLDNATVNATIDELRQEYGADYRRNMNILDSHLTASFGEETADLLKNARLGDGTPMLANATVVRSFVDQAIEKNPVSTVVPGAGTNQASAIEDELKALRKLQMTDPKTYWSDETQARELELISAQQKLK